MLLKYNLLFLIIPFVSLASGEDDEIVLANFCYNATYEGFWLNTKVYMTTAATHWINCAKECVEEPCCRSINFKKIVTTQSERNCEMLHNVVYNTSEKLLEKNASYDYIYFNNPRKDYNATCLIPKDISCTVLKSKYPSLTDGYYLINPGGPDFPEFSVHCDMTAKDGVGVTEIGHDSENRTEVTGNGAGKPYYGRNITYEVSMDEIVAITKQSRYCEQFIKYECNYSWLLRKDYGWWVSRQGIRMNYWGGAAIDSGKCACGMTNTCEGGQPRCNCDEGVHEFREDSGYLSDINTLPVTQLRFGDTDRSSEYGFHTLGKLRCWG